MYDRILVPLDGSPEAEAALAFAQHLPSRALRLLRVDPDFEADIDTARAAESGWRTFRQEEIERELHDAVARHLIPADRLEIAVRFGDPAEAILAEAETSGASLIVMTTHGRGAAGRVVFGSTADRICRHGTIPVLMLRGGAHPVAPRLPSRIVVPLDGSDLAESALPEATKLAEALRVPTLLLRVVDLDEIITGIGFELYVAGKGDPAGAEYDRVRAAQERAAAEYLERVAEQLRPAARAVGTEVQSGTPVFVLLELVSPADLVVMATHGRGGLRRWLIGSVAEKLVREAAGPVLLVPTRGVASATQPT